MQLKTYTKRDPYVVAHASQKEEIIAPIVVQNEVAELKRIIRLLGQKLQEVGARRIAPNTSVVEEELQRARLALEEERRATKLQLLEAKKRLDMYERRLEAEPEQSKAYMKLALVKQQLEDEAAALRCQAVAIQRRMSEALQHSATVEQALENLRGTYQKAISRLECLEGECMSLREALRGAEYAREQERIETTQQQALACERQLVIHALQEKTQELQAKACTYDARLQEAEEQIRAAHAREEQSALHIAATSRLLEEERKQRQESLLHANEVEEYLRQKLQEIANLHHTIEEKEAARVEIVHALELREERLAEQQLHLQRYEEELTSLREKSTEAIREYECELALHKAKEARYETAERLISQLHDLICQQEEPSPLNSAQEAASKKDSLKDVLF